MARCVKRGFTIWLSSESLEGCIQLDAAFAGVRLVEAPALKRGWSRRPSWNVSVMALPLGLSPKPRSRMTADEWESCPLQREEMAFTYPTSWSHSALWNTAALQPVLDETWKFTHQSSLCSLLMKPCLIFWSLSEKHSSHCRFEPFLFLIWL